MNPAIDELASSILKKPLHDCSLSELRQMTIQYPWFGPGQLLYASKLKDVDTRLFEEQLEKSTLYFQNRLWLDHLLNDNGEVDFIEQSPAQQSTTADAFQGEITVDIHHDVVEYPTSDTKQVEVAQEPQHVEPATVTNHIEEIFEEKEEEVIQDLPVNTSPPEPTEAPLVVGDESNESDKQDLEDTSQDTINDKDEPALAISPLRMEKVDLTKSPMVFEPFHTVDYFASQGIKMKEEDRPKDRFGQQLKSFTEWLKAMKKVPASEIADVAPTDPGSEKKVEQMAEHSLAERHVVTEAMAEVWTKQGNTAKAEDIYQKLSLLDPSKTAYFAAKIEELKKTS
ncbi:MAG: hypothetical protein H7Y42_08835 [Chitinophagaceae bacterium]|nr:hypothetical protein [Chitinophagaceae bacterium]